MLTVPSVNNKKKKMAARGITFVIDDTLTPYCPVSHESKREVFCHAESYEEDS